MLLLSHEGPKKKEVHESLMGGCTKDLISFIQWIPRSANHLVDRVP